MALTGIAGEVQRAIGGDSDAMQEAISQRIFEQLQKEPSSGSGQGDVQSWAQKLLVNYADIEGIRASVSKLDPEDLFDLLYDLDISINDILNEEGLGEELRRELELMDDKDLAGCILKENVHPTAEEEGNARVYRGYQNYIKIRSMIIDDFIHTLAKGIG